MYLPKIHSLTLLDWIGHRLVSYLIAQSFCGILVANIPLGLTLGHECSNKLAGRECDSHQMVQQDTECVCGADIW